MRRRLIGGGFKQLGQETQELLLRLPPGVKLCTAPHTHTLTYTHHSEQHGLSCVATQTHTHTSFWPTSQTQHTTSPFLHPSISPQHMLQEEHTRRMFCPDVFSPLYLHLSLYLPLPLSLQMRMMTFTFYLWFKSDLADHLSIIYLYNSRGGGRCPTKIPPPHWPRRSSEVLSEVQDQQQPGLEVYPCTHPSIWPSASPHSLWLSLCLDPDRSH